MQEEAIRLQVRTVTGLEEIPRNSWNALKGTTNPFLRHEFLAALERHGAAVPANGWQPMHLLLEEADGALLAAAPAYVKANSWGEFVFDWSWASAYRQAGLEYYPKLVLAVPFSPVPGPRVLTGPRVNPGDACRILASAAEQLCRQQDWSGVHCLFPDDQQMRTLGDTGWLYRMGCQFHWENRGYTDFNAFLESLSSRKRKNIKRERRIAAESGLEFAIVPGHRVTADDWHAFHSFYARTFDEHGNLPVLTPDFFREIGAGLGNAVQMVQARLAGNMVGAALLLRSDDTLYGRYWGCRTELPGMHFETCYYQGIDYCIREGLVRFEPGAQGEHKVPRGFLPRSTHSLHWISEPGFHEAIARFLDREKVMLRSYMDEMNAHSPYRNARN